LRSKRTKDHTYSTLLPAPPPSSTLSPYTTLFRSRQRAADPSRTGCAVDGSRKRRAARRGICGVAAVSGDDAVNATSSSAVLSQTDRKSTRLNSSHVNISYAVFCLKKKNKIKKNDK